jgi:hypothetical protein
VRPDALPDDDGENCRWLKPAPPWLELVTGMCMLALLLAVPLLLVLVAVVYVTLWTL